MADDRAAETDIDAIARLSAELADLRSTLLARVGRSATGTVEPTILLAPKPDTLLLQGQDVNRADYPGLWQWVQDHGLLVAGLFDIGDGTTTFGLPDFRGRLPVGAGTLGADAYAVGATGGAASRALTTAQMPAHDHNVTVPAHGTHNHDLTGGGGTSGASGGNHGGHFPAGGAPLAAAGGDLGLAPWNGGVGNNAHNHSLQVAVYSLASGAGSHPVTETTVGGTTAVDLRAPYIAINWAIWT